MKKYSLALNVRYFYDDKNIYFRKGIWNTIDGIIPLNSVDDIENFSKLLERLDNAEVHERDIEVLSNKNKGVFNDLIQNGFVIHCDNTLRLISKIFTGNEFIENNRIQHFDLITDSQITLDALALIKKEYGLHYKLLNQKEIDFLCGINFSSKVNSLEFEKRIIESKKIFNKNYPKLILLENFDVSLCKNINQIIEDEPLMVGFIDGPFMIFTTLLKTQTGCWDCFEQRMLANIKDMLFYHKFKTCKKHKSNEKTYNLHFSQLLNMGLQEIFSWNILKMCKMMGRAYFTYLPTMEFHIQNVDRISSCPSCGALSVIDCIGHNISLERIIEELNNYDI